VRREETNRKTLPDTGRPQDDMHALSLPVEDQRKALITETEDGLHMVNGIRQAR
jgi:hypothetical protein